MPDYSALPDEVVAETILWRLPVKSIMQCRCVCKSWYSLITSPNFISTHVLRKTLTLNPQTFLNQKDYNDNTGNCVLLFDNQDYFRSMSFHVPFNPPSPSIYIVGSVNGLICFSTGQGRALVNLILCNPSIGHFQSIPPPHSSSMIDWRTVKGFGFDERTLDYKILLIGAEDSLGFIYSLNSDSWRSITCSFPKNWNMMCHSVHFVNGRFHWLARYYRPCVFNWIMVFDVKSESFSHISLPECLENSRSIRFMEFGESSIAILEYQEYVSHIWIMKEYGSLKSWMKLTLDANPPQMRVLGFRNKDEVLIRCWESGYIGSRKISNNKSDQLEEVKKMMDLDKSPTLIFSVHKYVPSLVLLDKENNVDVAAPTHTNVDLAAATRTTRITRGNVVSMLIMTMTQ